MKRALVYAVVIAAMVAVVSVGDGRSSLSHPNSSVYPLNFQGLIEPAVSTGVAKFQPGSVVPLKVSVRNNSTDTLWDPNLQLYFDYGLKATNVVSWKPTVTRAKFDGFNNRTAWLTGSLPSGKQKVWTVDAKVPMHLSPSIHKWCFYLTMQMSTSNESDNWFDYAQVCRPIAGT